jgi:hypothetical protein
VTLAFFSALARPVHFSVHVRVSQITHNRSIFTMSALSLLLSLACTAIRICSALANSFTLVPKPLLLTKSRPAEDQRILHVDTVSLSQKPSRRISCQLRTLPLHSQLNLDSDLPRRRPSYTLSNPPRRVKLFSPPTTSYPSCPFSPLRYRLHILIQDVL